MQFVFKYCFIDQLDIEPALKNWQFYVLVLATITIAAGGYVINNILDVSTDLVNKPQNVVIGKNISEKHAYNLYFALTIIGVGCGFYLSNVIDKPSLTLVFILSSIVLYLYATSLKQSLIIGNLLVAALTSVSVLLILVFELYPIINTENQPLFGVVFKIILDYAIFAFLINFIREIVKDLEDYQGDLKENMKTLPIILGISKTTKIVAITTFLLVIYLFYYVYTYYFQNNLNLAAIYCFVFVIAPLIYIFITIFNSNSTSKFREISTILKFVLLFGIISAIVIKYNLSLNA